MRVLRADGAWTSQVGFCHVATRRLDRMANSVPILTGLTTPGTFLENTVNGAPQIIAADVTFTDPDNNFDGGTLTVTGLLPQDMVAIRNQGSGAGQIGISGSNVTFGGILIGSFAGGAGSTLAVTFNASA